MALWIIPDRPIEEGGEARNDRVGFGLACFVTMCMDSPDSSRCRNPATSFSVAHLLATYQKPYDSVAELHAASLNGRFEQPAMR